MLWREDDVDVYEGGRIGLAGCHGMKVTDVVEGMTVTLDMYWKE